MQGDKIWGLDVIPLYIGINSFVLSGPDKADLQFAIVVQFMSGIQAR